MLTKNDDCFRCHCSCAGLPENGMDQKLIDLLNAIPGLAPDMINCGYRCKNHNAAVGGVANSQHIDGTAADIDAGKWGVEWLARMCEELSADGVGRYPEANFVHCDTREGRTNGGYRWNG